MADTQAATGLTVQQWDANFYKEFLNSNRFAKEIGKSPNSIIQIKENLTTKKGDSITFALVNRLTGAGVEGDAVLEGNEEAMVSRSQKVTVAQIRHAVRTSESQEQFSAIPLRNANRSVLMDWQMENFRDRIIAEFGSINGVPYADATETQKDAWLVDNADRVLFGALKSNAGVDHSAGLANIDNTADKLTTAAVSLMKRIALTASPKIRPIRVTEDKRFFVMYANPLSFRDLKADSTITQAQREAMERGPNNILFTGGDLHWDGVIIKEIEDFPIVTDSTIDVGRANLTGAQAIAFGVAKRPNTVTKDFDYGDKHGLAIREMLGVDKMLFGTGNGDTDDLKDHGMVTGWFAAVADV
ncbi:MAG: DUF4043 family protein [Rhodospirillaceae bacterium]|nr:DUF4043 family protein [Rhodospirillaceae bacterium]